MNEFQKKKNIDVTSGIGHIFGRVNILEGRVV